MKLAHSLDDLARHQGCIVAECSCGRTALFSVRALIELCKARGWSRNFNAVVARFLCTGCKGRPRCYFAQPPVPAWTGLCMVVRRPPPGVGLLQWASADDRERKRLMALSRG